MKGILRHIMLLPGMAALILTGCVKESDLSFEGDIQLHLVSTSGRAATKAVPTEAGESDYNENTINRAWVYLFPSGATTTTPAAFASGKVTTFTTHDATHCDKVVTLTLSAMQKSAVLGSGTVCKAYVIVNLPAASESALAALGSTPTVEALKQVEISATATASGDNGFNERTFGETGIQPEFVMDSELTAVDVSNQPVVDLKRAASKIRLFVAPAAFTATDDDQVEHTYEYRGTGSADPDDQMKVYIQNGVTRSALDCESATGGTWRTLADADYYYLSAATALPLASSTRNETYDGKTYCTHDIPLYSYSTDWSTSPARSEETYLTLMVPWYIDGVRTVQYYRVMVDSEFRRLQRNWYYKIYVDLRSVGSPVETPTEIEISYLVLDWTKEIMNWTNADEIYVPLQQPRYLSVERPTMEFHQGDGTVSGSSVTYTIPFRSSHDCVMSHIRAYSEIYKSENWMAHRSISSEKQFKDRLITEGNETDAVTGFRVTETLSAQDSFTSSNGDFVFSIIAPSDGSDLYTLQVTAPAFTSTYMPVYIDLTLHHELVDHTDDTYYKQFYQALSITLLPNISYSGEFSGGQMNYPEYTTSAEIPYYLQSQQPWVLVNGFGYPHHHHLKSVDDVRWNVSGDILDYNWGFMRYTGGDGVYPWNTAMSDNGSTDYNNIRKALGGVMPPMTIMYFVNANNLGRFTSWMPIITVSEAPEGTLIGDPRQHTSDLLTSYNNENSSTRTMTQFMRTGGWVYAPDANTGAVRTQDENYWIYSTTEKHDPADRKLEHYYPTAEDEATMSVIAPKLRVASSWADTKPLSYVNAKRRCASYQEKGIPAGRWRLPTKAEMQLICEMTMNRSRDFPPLLPPYSRYNGEVRYWYAGGMVRYDNSKKEFEFIDYDFDRLNKGYNTWTCQVRPVYDEWFWPETRDFDTSVYGSATGSVQDEESRSYYQNVVVYKIREFKWGDMKIW